MSGLAGQMATRAASSKAEGLLSPLLPVDDDSSSEGDGSSASSVEVIKQTPLQKLKTAAVYVVLGGGVAASAAACVFSPAILVFVAGGICAANAPFAAYKEKQLSKEPTLRGMNNRLREDANRLEDEVDTLSEEIDILVPEADRAKAVEEELRGIADRQQVNVNKLVELVKENEEMLAKMQDNLRQRIVQDIISIVMKSDRDNDQSIDPKEAKTLALKIRLQLQEYDVEFDSEKFTNVIKKNPTIPGVIAVVQKLLPSGKTDATYEDNEPGDDSDDDLYDMFYLNEEAERRATTCSVAGARANHEVRHKRMSLCPGGLGSSKRTSLAKKH